MAKDNKDSVKDYHQKLKEMKVRFPKEDAENGIPDYSSVIKSQAKMLGKSANEYILDLIQNDIQSNPDGLHQEDFEFIKGFRSIEK